MSVTTSTLAGSGAPSSAGGAALRFGREDKSDDGNLAYEWVLKRNCSMEPKRVLVVLALLGALSIGIGLVFWTQGATLVMPFASAELLAVGVALLVYARHAADNERIALSVRGLIVEHTNGTHVQRVTLRPAWVRIEPKQDDRSLIELSSQGQRVAVGRFVRPELRAQLAEELRAALQRWTQLNRT